MFITDLVRRTSFTFLLDVLAAPNNTIIIALVCCYSISNGNVVACGVTTPFICGNIYQSFALFRLSICVE